jgi:hypothetical protein
MYILILHYRHGGPDYFGPFPSVSRAMDYAEIAKTYSNVSIRKLMYYTISPLILPHSVVHNVIWRGDDNT